MLSLVRIVLGYQRIGNVVTNGVLVLGEDGGDSITYGRGGVRMDLVGVHYRVDRVLTVGRIIIIGITVQSHREGVRRMERIRSRICS